jgi:curved DNA-binding protein CbpA
MSENKYSLINPYDLLGFDSKQPNISMIELKKQYFMLSLICHPDKGGNSEDMIILKNSYQYIKEQIEGKDEKSRDFKIVEEEFKEFMKTQSDKAPSFSSIYEEAHLWLQDFNKEFEKNKTILNDIEHDYNNDGYGNLMDNTNNMDLNIDRDDEIKIKPTIEFKSELIAYTEPLSFNHNSSNGHDINRQKITDYTIGMGSDYKKAYTIYDNDIDDKKFLKTEIITKNDLQVDSNLEKLLAERHDLDNILYNSEIQNQKEQELQTLFEEINERKK